MPLRVRVGRHPDGRQCQNWADDQKTVTGMLNAIRFEDGGAHGSLQARVIAGIASDELCYAIKRFEDQQFPQKQIGFVEPGGAMLKRMQEPAVQAAARDARQAGFAAQLEFVRQSLLWIAAIVAKFPSPWSFGDRVQLDALVEEALRDVAGDEATVMIIGYLPPTSICQIYGEVFVIGAEEEVAYDQDDDVVWYFEDRWGKQVADKVNGYPGYSGQQVVTSTKGPALLKFESGPCYPIQSGRAVAIFAAWNDARAGYKMARNPAPLPRYDGRGKW